jgi:hypothetical protein
MDDYTIDSWEDSAANMGWSACGECGEWDATNNMVVVDGYHYCQECTKQHLHNYIHGTLPK